jgi:hypothetical protein
MKNSNDTIGNRTATFCFVAQSLNQKVEQCRMFIGSCGFGNSVSYSLLSAHVSENLHAAEGTRNPTVPPPRLSPPFVTAVC